MNKNINILNQDSYLYELYNEYLNKVQFYQINGKINFSRKRKGCLF